MRSYQELSLDERTMIQLRHGQGQSMRSIGHAINRSASTVSRELRRVSGNAQGYQAQAAQRHATRCRHTPRVARKLADPARWAIVDRCLRVGWSPQHIAHTLRYLCPNDPSVHVSHETIYKAIYLIPRGELRRALVACLRQGRSTRKPRTRGEDRRGRIPDMQSIHVLRPADSRHPVSKVTELRRGLTVCGKCVF